MSLTKIWVLLFLLIGLNSKSFGQTLSSFEKDSLAAIQLFNIADSSFMTVDTCLKYTLAAIPLLQRTNQNEKYVYCLNALSYCYYLKQNLEEMDDNNHFALEEAKRLLSSDHYLYQAALNNLGVVYSNIREDYSKALELYRDAYDLSIKDRLTPLYKGSLCENIGMIYAKKGDYGTAINYYLKSIKFYEEAYNSLYKNTYKTFIKIVRVYQKIASIQKQQRAYDSAKIYLNKSLDMMERDSQVDKSFYINAYLELADINIKENAISKARFFINKATLKKGKTAIQNTSIAQLQGQIEVSLKNYKRAEFHFIVAEALVPDSKKALKSRLLKQLGGIYANLGKLEQATEKLEEAISLLISPLNKSESIQRIVNKPSFPYRIELIEVLSEKANLLQLKYESNGQVNYLTAALELDKLISELSDIIRLDYRFDQSRFFLSEKSKELNAAAINRAYILFEKTKEEKWAQIAFHFFEKSKAIILLDEILAKEAEGISILPKKIINQKIRIKTNISYHEKLIDIEKRKEKFADSLKLGTLKNLLFALREQEIRLKDSIQKEFPDYFEFIYGQTINIQNIQNELLDTSTILINFFINENKGYVLGIKKSYIEFYPIKNIRKLNSQIGKILKNLKLETAQSLSDFRLISGEIYDAILNPLNIDSINNLIIIPDGKLNFLPFELLTNSDSGWNTLKSIPYLINSHVISYAYSATILKNQNSIIFDEPIKGLVFSPQFKNTPQYLAFSKEEEKIFKDLNVTIFTGESANTTNFYANSNQYRLLHLSTHAVMNDSSINQPAIQFFDNPVYLKDLYNLNIPAQLVVLSACETNLGKEYKGEGIMSLARGFTYAGAKALLSSLWKVNEQATSSLLNGFYQNLQLGDQKAKALQKAKVNYLQTCVDHEAVPFYWAGFIIVGNTNSIIIQKKNYLNSILFLSISLSLLVLLFIITHFYSAKESFNT